MPSLGWHLPLQLKLRPSHKHQTIARIFAIGAVYSFLWAMPALADQDAADAAPSPEATAREGDLRSAANLDLPGEPLAHGSDAPAPSPQRGAPRRPIHPATAAPDAAVLDALPPAAPSPAGSVKVMLHESPVLTLHGTDPDQLQRRADAVQHALEEAAINVAPESIRVERRPGVAVVFAGDTPIVQLDERDAALAGDATLGLHAAQVSARIKEAIRKEKQRSAIARTVFSLSLVVFFGLIAIFLVRKLLELSARGRELLLNHSDAALAIRLQSLDLVSPATMRSGLLVGLSVGRWLAIAGILYTWLLVSLSLFHATRPYTEQLTGFVLGPVSQLVSRVASSLPLLAVAVLGILAVALLVRFVGLYFASAERGQTRLGWLPYDLTVPTSLLLRGGIILGALVFGAPVITGDADGVFTRGGLLLLGALVLASTPLLASVVVGIMVVFWRRIRVGDYTELGGRLGKVVSVDLLAVRLQDEQGAHVHVPHLLAMIHPTRTLGRLAHAHAEICVQGTDRVRELCGLLQVALAKHFEDPDVNVVGFTQEHVRIRVRVTSPLPNPSIELYAVLSSTLAASDFILLSGTLARE